MRSCSAFVTDCHIELGTHRSADLLIPCSPLALSDEDGHVEFIRFVWAKFDMHEKPVIGKRALSERPRSATDPHDRPFCTWASHATPDVTLPPRFTP